MLEAAHRHIRTRVPEGADPARRADVPRPQVDHRDARHPAASNAIRKFDIANVHLRGRAAQMAGVRRSAGASTSPRAASAASSGSPSTATPAEPLFQYDRAFRGGESAQAAFLGKSLPALRRGGARQVFVTLRDSWRSEFVGEYASEGVVEPRRALPVLRAAQAVVLRGQPAERPLAQGRAPARAAQARASQRARRYKRLGRKRAAKKQRRAGAPLREAHQEARPRLARTGSPDRSSAPRARGARTPPGVATRPRGVRMIRPCWSR